MFQFDEDAASLEDVPRTPRNGCSRKSKRHGGGSEGEDGHSDKRGSLSLRPLRPRGKGHRGDLSDDDDTDKSLDEPILAWPSEKTREEHPLRLVGDNPPDSDGSKWEELIGDTKLRSWMFAKHNNKSVEESDLEILLHGIDWTPLSGATGRVTRKTAWLVSGRCCCPYRYGGEEVKSTQMPDWFEDMRSRWLQDAVGHCQDGLPNCVNLNLYEHGMHGVNWHADDEVLFGGRTSDCTIVSVSLGASRRFRAGLSLGRRGQRLVVDRSNIQDVELRHGTICTMEGLFQKHYIHKLSKCRKDRAGLRINATFRWIKCHARGCPLRPLRPVAPPSFRRNGSSLCAGDADAKSSRLSAGDRRRLARGSGREKGPRGDEQFLDIIGGHLFDGEKGRPTPLGLALFWAVAISAWTASLLL
eukprot:TRINITY_DN6359_c0_g1_i1.p1 TRINITY_DN6359_c0_g1~~TRINITY_DN6359_c0_g1_i1.p1  ORF type:complete len:414 (-),score=50.18 TRINITY_DN6359_c0_g1_i1:77-1318(-)